MKPLEELKKNDKLTAAAPKLFLALCKLYFVASEENCSAKEKAYALNLAAAALRAAGGAQ